MNTTPIAIAEDELFPGLIDLPPDMRACFIQWTIIAVVLVVVMAALGLLMNMGILVVMVRKWNTAKFLPIDWYMGALVIEDVLYNMLGVIPNAIADIKHGLQGVHYTNEEYRLFSMFCCFFNATTILLLFVIGIDRFLAVFYPFYKGRTVLKAKLQVIGVPVFIAILAVFTWYRMELLVVLFFIPPLNILLYVATFLKVHASKKGLKKEGEGLSPLERSLATSAVGTALLSLVGVIPCFYAYALYFYEPFMDMRMLKYTDCNWMALNSMVHHPLSGFNYLMHPVLFYISNKRFRTDVRGTFGVKDTPTISG